MEPVPLPGPADGLPYEVSAQLAGYCIAGLTPQGAGSDCSQAEQLAACSAEHCQLGACVEACGDHLACVQELDDPCAGVAVCPPSAQCAECRNAVLDCSLHFCIGHLLCPASSTPDGPCSRLEACCALQAEGAAECLEGVQAAASLGGDATCYGVMMDWDFVAHLTVPCRFED